MITIVYLDACPKCPPGIPPASPAVGEPEQVPGGIITAHQCEVCDVAWSTFWREGWPVDRLIAPLTSDRNRGVLGTALKDAARTEAA